MTTDTPRLGFLGLGWIGRHRLEAVAASGAARPAALCDSDPAVLNAVARAHPEATACASFETLLEEPLDGVVIATPSALHAAQASRALSRGRAVFCQKPLGREAAEVAEVVAMAARVDRLLGADFCYRELAGMAALRRRIRAGELGEIFAVELTFHNAYGPDKPWFYDRELAGGGCVMDLGIHLVDLAQWCLGNPEVVDLRSHLYAAGRRLQPPLAVQEDYACADWRLASGANVRLACSWNLAAGQDAWIEALFYGTRGGAALRNVGGSFYDFTVELFHGTARERLGGYPDAWGGRALIAWCQRLAEDQRFDRAAEDYTRVARVVDGIYARCGY